MVGPLNDIRHIKWAYFYSCMRYLNLTLISLKIVLEGSHLVSDKIYPDEITIKI